MRKIKLLNLLCFALLTMSVVSCDDVLDKQPSDRISEDAVFNDLGFLTAFLNETYDGVPSGFERGHYLLESATDLSENGYPWPFSQNWNQGDFSPTSPPRFNAPWDDSEDTQWRRGYNFIRRTNLILSNVDQLQADEATRNMITGEAYFLRALFYHELVKLYGGVVLIDKAQAVDEGDALLVLRSSFEESVDFIIADLDRAAELLPPVRTGKDVGRASRAAALALKGRQLLYAERWTESASASKMVMEIPEITLFPDYEQMFWAVNNNNSETIFARQYLSRAKDRYHESHVNNSIPTKSGWGGTQPTQNLVDKFEMIDGLSYDKSPLYNPNNPYANRDPRFYATVLHDSMVWIGETLRLYQGAFQGIDGSTHDRTRTGYFLRKFMDPAIITTDVGNGYNNWIILRLGEVLLNYAEAQNEAIGPDQSVYDAVNAVRQRPSVNQPPLPTGLTKDQMRERIRQERTIELAFEEHRFFDLRRWKDASGQYLANTVLNEPVYGMRINKQRTTYERFKHEDRKYDPRHRLLPIPQTEIVKYAGELEQNPGW